MDNLFERMQKKIPLHTRLLVVNQDAMKSLIKELGVMPDPKTMLTFTTFINTCTQDQLELINKWIEDGMPGYKKP